jgi:hypothetical protein
LNWPDRKPTPQEPNRLRLSLTLYFAENFGWNRS